MDWGLEKVKEDKTDCYLEASPAGYKLYKGKGFEDVAPFYIFGKGPFQRMVWRGRLERVPYGKLASPEAVLPSQ
jgi:hypothetical protein